MARTSRLTRETPGLTGKTGWAATPITPRWTARTRIAPSRPKYSRPSRTHFGPSFTRPETGEGHLAKPRALCRAHVGFLELDQPARPRRDRQATGSQGQPRRHRAP